jgi:hypothetical protein
MLASRFVERISKRPNFTSDVSGLVAKPAIPAVMIGDRLGDTKDLLAQLDGWGMSAVVEVETIVLEAVTQPSAEVLISAESSVF